MPPIPRRPPRIQGDLVTGNGIAFLGDSITQADAQNSTGLIGSRSYGVMACMISGGRLRFVRNAGVSGNRLAQMLARLDDDVIAYDPDFCLVLGGINDIINFGTTEPLTGETITQATMRSTMTAIYQGLRAAGIQPIAATLTPRSATTGNVQVEQFDAWIRTYAARNGMWLVDFAAEMTDPLTFGWLGGGTVYNIDGLHPNAAGQRKMAQRVVDDLAGLLPNGSPYLDMFGQTGTTGANMLKSGCFQADTNADGISDNWVLGGSGTGATLTRETDPAIIGYWQKMVASTGVLRYFDQTIPSGSLWSVGDRVAFSGLLTTTGIVAGGLTINAALMFTNGSSSPLPNQCYPLWSFALDVSQWRFYAEAIIPSGTTQLEVQLIGTADGTGTVQWAQVTLVNLTKMGIA